MSRHECKRARHRTVGAVETLEDRVVLNAGTPVPATPAPAPSPINAVAIERFVHKLDRIDATFLKHAKQLSAKVAREAAHAEATLATLATRPQVKLQLATSSSSSGTTTTTTPVTATPALSQLQMVVSSFNVQMNQFNNAYEAQFGLLSTPLVKADSLALNVPLTAIENNLQEARFGFSQAATSAASTSVIGGSTIKTPPAATTTTTTATTATTTPTVGVVSTETFSNIYTQDFSTLTSVISGIDATLAQDFGGLGTTVSTLASPLASTSLTSPALPTISLVTPIF